MENDSKFCTNCGYKLDHQIVQTDNTPIVQQVLTQEIDQTRETGFNNSTVKTMNKPSAISVLSFILSFTYFLSPIAIGLAVIDLLKNKGRKHGLSIAALIIGGILTIGLLMTAFSSCSPKTSSIKHDSESTDKPMVGFTPQDCEHGVHKWKEATCQEPRTCTECGATEGEALGHNWKGATCTEPKTCVRCGEVDGEALGHEWKDATCTEPKTCTCCGVTEGEAIGHEWVDATCTEPKTCSRCNATEGKPKGHVVNKWEVKEKASCSKTGTEVGICEVCGEKQTHTIKKLLHDFGDWKTVKKATCSTYGSEERTCKVCKHSETRTIQKQNHSGKWVIVTEATYSEPGTRYMVCVNCGEKRATESYSLTEEEKTTWLKKNCKKNQYTDLARSPDKYIGQYVMFDCYILQVASEAKSSLSYSTYRAATKGKWDNVVYLCVDNYGTGLRILEDDKIQVYGTFDGLFSYTTILGATITIPKVIVLYYETK